VSDEKLELRARVLNEMIEQTGTWGLPELEEFDKISKELEPFTCPSCFKVVLSYEDYVLRRGKRTHKKCNEKIEEESKKAREILEDQKKRAEQHKYEVENNLISTSRTLMITVRGLIKNIERFDSELGELSKKYHLEPWIRLSHGSYVQRSEVTE